MSTEQELINKESTKRKKGRPSKGELKRPRGRPPSVHKKAMQDFIGSILARPESPKVIETIFRHALDDESPKQQAAWSLIMDRIAPKSLVEQEATKGATKNAIQINITGIGQPSTTVTEDAEYTEITDDED